MAASSGIITNLFNTQDEVDTALKNLYSPQPQILKELTYFFARLGCLPIALQLNHLLPKVQQFKFVFLKPLSSDQKKFEAFVHRFYNDSTSYADKCGDLLCNVELNRQYMLAMSQGLLNRGKIKAINQHYEHTKALIKAEITQSPNVIRFLTAFLKQKITDTQLTDSLKKDSISGFLIRYTQIMFGSDNLFYALYSKFSDQDDTTLHYYQFRNNKNESRTLKMFSPYIQKLIDAKKKAESMESKKTLSESPSPKSTPVVQVQDDSGSIKDNTIENKTTTITLIEKIKNLKIVTTKDELKSLSEEPLASSVTDRIEQMGLYALRLNLAPEIAHQILHFLPVARSGNITLDQIKENRPIPHTIIQFEADGMFLLEAIPKSLQKFKQNEITNDEALLKLFGASGKEFFANGEDFFGILGERFKIDPKKTLKVASLYLTEMFTLFVQSIIKLEENVKVAEKQLLSDSRSTLSETKMLPCDNTVTTRVPFSNIAPFPDQKAVDAAIINFQKFPNYVFLVSAAAFLYRLEHYKAAFRVNEFVPHDIRLPMAAVSEEKSINFVNPKFHQSDVSYKDALYDLIYTIDVAYQQALVLFDPKSRADRLFLEQTYDDLKKLISKTIKDYEETPHISVEDFFEGFFMLISKSTQQSLHIQLTYPLLRDFLINLYASPAIIRQVRPEITSVDDIDNFEYCYQLRNSKSELVTTVKAISPFIRYQIKKFFFPIQLKTDNLKPFENYDELKAACQLPLEKNVLKRIEQIGLLFLQFKEPKISFKIFQLLPLQNRGKLLMRHFAKFEPSAKSRERASLYPFLSFYNDVVALTLTKLKKNSLTHHPDLLKLFSNLFAEWPKNVFTLLDKLSDKISANPRKGAQIAALYLTQIFDIFSEGILKPEDRSKFPNLVPSDPKPVAAPLVDEAKDDSIKSHQMAPETKEAANIEYLSKAYDDPNEIFFNSKDQLQEFIQRFKVLIKEDFDKNILLFPELVRFIICSGNMIAGRKLLSYIKDFPELANQKAAIEFHLKSITHNMQMLQQIAANPHSYVCKSQSKEHITLKARELKKLREIIITRMYLPKKQCKPLLVELDKLIAKPYSLDNLINCLISHNVEAKLIFFIVYECCVSIFVRPQGITLPSMNLPKLIPSALPAKKVPKKKITTPTLPTSERQLEIFATTTLKTTLIKEHDQIDFATQASVTMKDEASPSPQVMDSVPVAASDFPQFEQKLPAVEATLKTTRLFSLPSTPSHLQDDERFIRFQKSFDSLNASQQDIPSLEEAYDQLVLFKHHLTFCEVEEKNIFSKHYKRSLDAVYSAELALQLANLYIEKSSEAGLLKMAQIAWTKKAIEKLAYARCYRYAEFRCDEMLIVQYKNLISLSESDKHADIENKIFEIAEEIANKKIFIAKLRHDHPDTDPITASLREKSTAPEMLKVNEIEFETTSAVELFAAMPLGDKEACLSLAFEALAKAKQSLIYRDRRAHLLLCIQMCQHVNGILTVDSGDLLEDSAENTDLLEYRDRVIAIVKAEATLLLNTEYQGEFANFHLLERRRLIDNALRYTRKDDETNHPILISLIHARQDIVERLALKETEKPKTTRVDFGTRIATNLFNTRKHIEVKASYSIPKYK